jgi:hypothetical protein
MPIGLATDIVTGDVTALDPTGFLAKLPDEAWFPILAYVNTLPDTAIDPGGGADGPAVHLARLFLAAHFATCILRGGGAVGPVTGETAGGLRRTYGLMMLKTGVNGLNTTQWGLQFQVIVELSPAHGPITL